MDIFKLFGTVVVKTKDAIEALEETSKKAEDTSQSVEKVGQESKKAGSTTTSSLKPLPPYFAKVATAAGAVVTAVVAIGSAMIAVADNTREYRTEMGKLETAFTMAGHSGETATETYRELYSVLGETDRSVEASQHLARLCETEEELKLWTDICIGAFATFDDSLPIEGLAEAANETAKTGQLTGVLADALNWAGVEESEFQANLDACNSERERAALITETLNGLYGDAASVYKELNEGVIGATEAQEKLNEATARWGEIFEPFATNYRESMAAILNFFADIFEWQTNSTGIGAEYLVGTLETAEEAAEKIASLQASMEKLSETPNAIDYEVGMERLALAIAMAEEEYNRLIIAEQRAAESAQTTANETTDALLSAHESIPSNAETINSAYAEIMQNDTSMETAAQESVDRTVTAFDTATESAGFDSAGSLAMDQYIKGINSREGAVLNAVARIAAAAVKKMKETLEDLETMAGNAGAPGLSVGLDYVPYDEFPAMLHKGEAVLTAAEAAVWRAGKNNPEVVVQQESQKQTSSQSGITIVQHIQTVPQTPVEFAAATEAYFEQARWAMA